MTDPQRPRPRPRPRPKNPRKRRQQTKGQPADLWRNMPEPPTPEPIVPASQPSALLDSLGPPPLQDRARVAAQYFAAVVERAAGLATALASSADLLAENAEQ